MRFTIPSIVSGGAKYGDNITLKYHTKGGEIEILMPDVNDNDVKKISKLSDVHDLSVKEIIDFYSRVGKLWSRKRYDLRKDAVELTEKVTGYSEAMIENSYGHITAILSRDNIEHTLDAEMKDVRFLDEWVKVKDIFVHAQPRGKVLHVLSGNAPPIGPMSMLRGSLTKNVNIVKVASGDPVTPVYFALSFRDVDEDHPIAKTTSVVYWEHDSEVENKLISLSNTICVWGGRQGVENIKGKVRYGQHILEFGPRRSMQLIGRQAFENLKHVTDQAAHDIVLYDQEACHSPQFAFVEDDAEKFCRSLAESLDEEGKRLPKGHVSMDKHAQISHERAMAKFYGEKVYHPKGTEWTLIISKDVKRTLRHPLSRTLYVFEVNDLKDALQYVDGSIQTVALYPPERIKDLRDELTLRGADRVTHVGKMAYFAVGAPHDGIYPLTHLVRWVKSR